MTSTRTDIHRPSAPEFDPQAYTCVGVFDLNPDGFCPGEIQHRNDVVGTLVARGYRFAGSAGGCGHCGANIRYAALMIHSNKRDMLYVGETCLDNRFDSGLTAAEFQRLRKAAALNRERTAKVSKITTLVEAHPFLAWLTYRSEGIFSGIEVPSRCWSPYRDGRCHEQPANPNLTPDQDEWYGNSVPLAECQVQHTKWIFGSDFLADVAARFLERGELSENQIAAVARILPDYFAKIETKSAEIAAEQTATEADPGRYAAEPGAKKVTVTGTVKVALDLEGDYGMRRLVVVEGTGEHEGITAKITGTSAWLWDAEKGQDVTLVGTVKPIDKNNPQGGHQVYKGRKQTVMIRTTRVA